MSFYLQAATETADLIDHGEIQEGSKTNHSDFERLLGITEIKKKQLRVLEEKRIQSLEELEEGRRRRAELRDQMQHARNEAIIAQRRQQKEDDQKKQQEQTLSDRLNAALAKQGVVVLRGVDSEGDNNNNNKNFIGVDSSSSTAASNSVIKYSHDPFLRFRAEDDRLRLDKDRLNGLRMVHGKHGSDILRRFIEGASDWTTRQQQEQEQEEENAKEQQKKQEAINQSGFSNNTTSTNNTISTSSSNSHQYPLTSAVKQELRVPTVANLVTHGYGKSKSKSLANDAVRANQKVEEAFRQLDEKDRHDFNEWQHRRNFYDRERIVVLEQMKAEGFFRHSFSDDAAPKGSKLDRNGNLAAGTATSSVLGHKAGADRPQRKLHPLDDYREAVRRSVEEMHNAEETWKILTANQVEEISALQRATDVSSASRTKGAAVTTNSGLFAVKRRSN